MSLLAYNPYCVEKSWQFDTEGRLYYPSMPSVWPWTRKTTPAPPHRSLPLNLYPHHTEPEEHIPSAIFQFPHSVRPSPYNPALPPPSARSQKVQFLTPLASYPRPSAPSIYESDFYNTHLFYEVLNLKQDDSFETIQNVRRHKIKEITQKFQRTGRENQQDFVQRMIYTWALHKFVTSDTIQEYDKNGDEYSKIRPSTITSFYPEFHNTHKLYAIAGAFKTDGPEQIMSALEKSVLWVLREKSSSKVAQKFRNDWFNACYILLDPHRKEYYDNGDRFGDRGVRPLFS